MKAMIHRVVFVALFLIVVLAGFSISYAENGTIEALQHDENCDIISERTPEQEKAFYDYIEEKTKTLGWFYDWSLEEMATFTEWMKEQGIPCYNDVFGLPGEDNMTAMDAVELARESVIDKYDIKETVLDEKFKVQIEFNVLDPDNPLWVIRFEVKDPKDGVDLGFYLIYIDDQTEEVLSVWSAADSHG
jgi:hypothetical protein